MPAAPERRLVLFVREAWPSVGTGTSLRDGLKVGDGARTGVGAVVVREIPAGELHVGVPAKRAEGG